VSKKKSNFIRRCTDTAATMATGSVVFGSLAASAAVAGYAAYRLKGFGRLD